MLLLEAWPQCILPSATVVFFDNNGQQFLSIKDVHIGWEPTNSTPLISQTNLDTGNFLFGTLQHFTMTP